MFKISFPYRAPYLAAIMLVACTTPLYLANLPNVKTLLIISLFFGILTLLKKNIIFIYVFIFLIIFSSFIYQAQQHQRNQLDFQYAKKQFFLTAEIVDFPKNSTYDGHINISLKVRLSADAIANDGNIVLRKNSILKISCYQCEKTFSLGQIWQFQAKLKPPLGSASWGAFDYEKYAFANRIVATGYLQERSAKKLTSQKSLLNRFRKNIHSMLDSKYSDEKLIYERKGNIDHKSLNSNNLALLKALIVGDRAQLRSEHWKLFRNTGTSHLMSISGLHITLVFFLMNFLIRIILSLLLNIMPLVLSRRLMENCFYRISLPTFSMFGALIIASFYAFATGLSVPTQRAILMLAIICMARLFSKNISLIEALSIAIIVILLVDPLSTLHNGFWLSAIAVLMIAVLVKGRDTKGLLHCRMALAMIPVTLLFFNNAPLISPLANVILIPIVSIIVLPFAFLLVLVSLTFKTIFSKEGVVSEYIDRIWHFLNMFIDMVWYLLELFSRWQILINEYIPLSLQNNRISITFLILTAGMTLVWRLAFARSLLLLPLLVFFLIEPREKLHEGEFSMTTLDVGQGLAIVLETANSYIIFDTGIGFSESDSAERIILPFLKHQGRKTVSHIIVSHADNDHIGGLQTLKEYYPLTPVLINETKNIIVNEPNTSSCYAKKWQQDGVNFEIFPEIQISESTFKTPSKKLKRNNRSCVMKVSSIYGAVLLPADIERVSEHYIAKNFPQKLKAQVLLAAHHGSRTSSTPVFLNKVDPKLVIISAAYFSPYGHPHQDVLTRLQQQVEKVLMTGRSGSIKINFLKDGIQRREFRALHPRFWYSEFLN